MFSKLSPLKFLVIPSLLSGALAAEQPLPKKLPEGFEASIFAAPPMVNYPTFLYCDLAEG